MSPLGLVTIASLAHQGAHIIALVPNIEAPTVLQLLLLLRESTKSETIYAEQCDMSNLHSITEFANRWNAGSAQATSAPGAATGAPTAAAPGGAKAAREELFPQSTPVVHRLDTVLFLPTDESTYKIGTYRCGTRHTYPSTHADDGAYAEQTYVRQVLAPFHLVNTLLPSLLLMPPNRDVRIVSVVSPWYAAGLAQFDKIDEPLRGPQPRVYQPWTYLGAATLHWIVLASELQRRVNLLAEADTRSRSKLPGIDVDEVTTVPTGTLQRKGQRSHISSVLVCPGYERSSQLTAFFGTVPPFAHHKVLSVLLWALLLALYPLFWLFGKSATRGADAALWGVTARLASGVSAPSRATREDILAPGESDDDARQWPGIEAARLYREGRIVVPPMPAQLEGKADASELWNKTEARVEALLGGIAHAGANHS